MSAETNGVSKDTDDRTAVVDDQLVRDLIVQNNRLEDRLDNLEDTVQQQEAKIGALQNRNKLLIELLFDDEKWADGSYTEEYDAGEFEPIAERTAALEEELNERVGSLEQNIAAISDLGREKTTKEEKITALIQFAKNKADDPESSRVSLRPNDIQGIAGVTQRYSYNLVDDLPEEYDFFLAKKDLKQYGDLQIDKSSQKRALVVDLDVLHEDELALNKFNNSRESERGR